MVAPKGPGHLVRREFVDGRGVPVLLAVEKDATGKAWDLAKSYAKAIGGLRAGGIKTTFTEETETDLFGEQAVLCGGASQLVMYGFETLDRGRLPARGRLLRVPARAEADRRPDVSRAASPSSAGRSPTPPSTATTCPVRGSSTRTSRRTCRPSSTDIQDGTFAKRFIDDQDAGAPEFTALREKGAQHPIEATGRELRELMSWIKPTTTTTSRATPAADPAVVSTPPRCHRTGAACVPRTDNRSTSRSAV